MPNRIKDERKRLKLTQKELADQFNQYIAEKSIDIKPVSYAAVSRWESEENDPKRETWETLANFFDVEIDYLQGRSDQRHSDISIAISQLNSISFSDDYEKDTAIKKTLGDILCDLYITIDDLKADNEDLQSQIDTINDPNEYDDEGNSYPKRPY